MFSDIGEMLIFIDSNLAICLHLFISYITLVQVSI